MSKINLNFMFWFAEFVILFGTLIWLFATFSPKRLDLFLFLSPADVNSVSDNPFFRLGWGIAGALMIGWGISLLAMNQKDVEGMYSSSNLIYFSIITWFILDSITSVLTGFYYNILGNVIFLVFGILAIRSYLKE